MTAPVLASGSNRRLLAGPGTTCPTACTGSCISHRFPSCPTGSAPALYRPDRVPQGQQVSSTGGRGLMGTSAVRGRTTDRTCEHPVNPPVLTTNKYRSRDEQVPFSRRTSTVLTSNKYRSRGRRGGEDGWGGCQLEERARAARLRRWPLASLALRRARKAEDRRGMSQLPSTSVTRWA